MTAIVLACQPRHNCLHLATDAAIYRQDQTVVAFGTKVWPISHWPGLVTCAGNAAAVPLFGWALAQEFSTWDDLVDGADAGLTKLADIVTQWGLGHSAVILAGISSKRGPEAYTFQTTETLPPGVTREEAEASLYFQPPYVLAKLPDVIMTPVATPEMAIVANYEGIDVDSDPETVVWSIRKVLTMQRHMPLPDGIGGIGGFAELSTVSAEGVTQRIVERWPDQIGAPLRHGTCDWRRWHVDNPKPGTSRLKREMAARKAGKLRVVK